MRDDEPRPVGTREELGTLTQGAPVFPGSSRLGIEPKTPGWLVQDPTTSPSGDLIPTIRGSGAHPGRGMGKSPLSKLSHLIADTLVVSWFIFQPQEVWIKLNQQE
jgi:hypothetical protein